MGPARTFPDRVPGAVHGAGGACVPGRSGCRDHRRGLPVRGPGLRPGQHLDRLAVDVAGHRRAVGRADHADRRCGAVAPGDVRRPGAAGGPVGGAVARCRDDRGRPRGRPGNDQPGAPRPTGDVPAGARGGRGLLLVDYAVRGRVAGPARGRDPAPRHDGRPGWQLPAAVLVVYLVGGRRRPVLHRRHVLRQRVLRTPEAPVPGSSHPPPCPHRAQLVPVRAQPAGPSAGGPAGRGRGLGDPARSPPGPASSGSRRTCTGLSPPGRRCMACTR
jgi:hypothetical protein